MSSFKRIGVLGGMGPQATILLQQRLVNSISADDDASHLPLLIDMNPQIPSRLDWILENQGRDPGPVLADMASALERAGVDALAMPCNTAHYFAPQISAAVGVPLLNMIVVTGDAIVDRVGSGATVGILASPATRQINLFKRAFAHHGLSVVYPAHEPLMLEAIRRIKSLGPTQADIDTLSAAAMDCQQHGADIVLVGCSEFSLIANQVESTLPVLDSLDVLVGRIVEFATSE